jgi:hypothetical protein
VRTRQLSDLQNDVLFQLDEVNSPKPVASDLTELLNQEWAELYDELIDSGEDYYLSHETISIVAGTQNYAVASNYYKTKGVDVVIGSDRIPAHRMQFEQRNDYPSNGWNWPHRILYAVWGNELNFVPIPTAAGAVIHWYAPAPLRMSVGTDTIDGVNGAELAMVYGAAQRAAMMLENWDLADHLGAKKQERWARILSTVRDRNIGEAQIARVVRGRPATRNVRGWWRS